MATLATAYVSIVADTKRIAPDVRKALGESEKAASRSGSTIGERLSSGIRRTLTGGMMAAGGVAAAAFGKALHGGFGRLDAIEQAQTKFEALGFTAQQQASLIDDVTNAVKGTAFATSEAADAAAMALAAGIEPGEQLTGVLSTIGDSASFANKSFSEVAPIFTKAINKGKVMGDTLTQLEENAIPATQSLAQHLGKTAREIQDMASKGEISFEDLQAAMDSAIGGQALKAGDTFSGLLANMMSALSRFGEAILQGPFSAAPGIFAAVGSAIDDVTVKAQAVIEYFNTGVDDTGYLFQAFGSREQADEIISTLDTIREKGEEFMQGIRGEETDGMFGTLGSGLRDIGLAIQEALPHVVRITSSLGEAGMGAAFVSITGAVSAVAPVLASVLVPILESLANLMSENQEVVNALVLAFVGMKTANAVVGPIGKVAGTLGTLGKAVTLTTKHFKLFGVAKALMGTGFAKMFPGLAKAGGLFAKLGPGVGKIAGLLKNGLVKGLRLAATGFKLLGKAIIANPIGAIVAAIVAVVAGLVWFFTKTETGRKIWAKFTEFLGASWEKIKSWASDTWESIVGVWNGLGEWFSGLWQYVADSTSAAWEQLKGWFTGGWEFLVGVWNGVGEWFSEKWESVKTTTSEKWEGIKTAISEAWNSIVEWFTVAWESYKALVSASWEMVKSIFSSAWDTIKNIFMSAWGLISGWITGQWNLFVSIVSTVFNAVWQFISNAWNNIVSTITNAWNTVSSWISSKWSEFTALVSSTWETVKSLTRAAWDAVRQSIQDAWERIKSLVSDAVANVISKLGEFVSGIRDKFNEAINRMREFPNQVRSVFSNAARWLIDAGKNIIRGLIDGIRSMAGLVAGAIRGVLPSFAHGAIGLSDGAAYANGGVTRYASGGREKHVAQIAKAGEWRIWAEDETGGEAYIPLARSKRRRSTAILADVAQRFGLNLLDKDGSKVSSYTPGGTGPVAGAVQRFADGGIRTKKNFLDFARGENVDGEQASGSLEGAPYQNYPSDPNAWGDCSYAMGKFAAFALGLATSGRKFSTVSQLNWLQANGANIGRGPEGTFRMGWYDNGGGQFGHTSGTLPDGTNVEMGGSAGGGKIGGSAVGWDWSRYTHHAWIPAKTSESTSAATGDADIPATGEPDIPVAGTDVDANMVEVPKETADKVESAGMDTSDDLPSSWSEFAGNVAKDVVSGQVEDILNVFGIKNELPPIMKAGKTLFVKTDEDDPTGEKAIGELDSAADAKIAADGAIEAEDAKPAEEDKPAEDDVPEVPAGSVSMGPYKLGMDFYLEEIARAAAERRMGFKGAKLATAAALVEVGDPLKMYASSVDTASQQYPYEAIGSDHDSSGLFQQRNNGAWGTIAQRMNARGSASMFLNALKKIAGWETMEEGAAVQAVQRSAFPNRYSQKMARAEELMSRFKGKLPGFKNGGLVRGGKSRIKDDILAMLQDGEYVINRDSVNADPEMAEALNSGGPQAVVDMVLNQAAGAAAAGAGGAAAAGIGGAAGLLNSVVPGMGAPVAAMAGPASWYAEQVAGGVASAFANAGSQIFNIGMSRIESVASAFGVDYGSNVAAFASPGALSSAFADGVDRVESRRTGGGDTYNFVAQDMSGMHSMYRREQAKANRGKVGAR